MYLVPVSFHSVRRWYLKNWLVVVTQLLSDVTNVKEKAVTRVLRYNLVALLARFEHHDNHSEGKLPYLKAKYSKIYR